MDQYQEGVNSANSQINGNGGISTVLARQRSDTGSSTLSGNGQMIGPSLNGAAPGVSLNIGGGVGPNQFSGSAAFRPST